MKTLEKTKQEILAQLLFCDYKLTKYKNKLTKSEVFEIISFKLLYDICKSDDFDNMKNLYKLQEKGKTIVNNHINKTLGKH